MRTGIRICCATGSNDQYRPIRDKARSARLAIRRRYEIERKPATDNRRALRRVNRWPRRLGMAFLLSPGRFSVAVGPPSFDDAELVASMARALAADGSHIRLSIEQTAGPIKSLERLKKRQAQLAVIRNLGDVPDRVRSIAILHSDPIAIIAPKSAKIENFRELADKTLGLVGPPGSYARLMAWMRLHYHGKFLSIDIPPVTAEIAAAMNAKKIDALLFIVPTTRSGAISERWASVRKLTRKSMDFVSIDDAEAIEAAAPEFEAGEISSGAFGGSPPVPAENVTTLLVTTYLVADQSVRSDIATELTRFIFENRQRFIPDAPVAALIKAASTDKDAIIPVHNGAKEFFDGEEQTLMERYGDWLYTGPIILGALYSALLAIWHCSGPPPGSPTAGDRSRNLLQHQERDITGRA